MITKFISRALSLTLLLMVAVFAAFNLAKVSIQLPGFEPITLSLAAAALIFFALGFVCCGMGLGLSYLKLQWELRRSRRKIRELESQLPKFTNSVNGTPT